MTTTWFMNIKNVKTGERTTLEIFCQVEIGALIGWGTDDGENIAVWEVQSCFPKN